jgi:glucose-6-phosphate isomerase
MNSLKIIAGSAEKRFREVTRTMDRESLKNRLFSKDPGLWKTDPETQHKIINRLGWLDCISEFRPRVSEILQFTEGVKNDGVQSVVLLGMGGSSLYPEVCAKTFGPAEGWPNLIVLDNTDPAAVRQVESRIEPENTLFLVSSKSGSTVETDSFYRYFFGRVAGKLAKEAGSRFVAITDPGSSLAREAEKKGFRYCFENPPNIGGRYSALSFFGLVPMALLGIDVSEILARAAALLAESETNESAGDNPALALGALWGASLDQGRDKLTLLSSAVISSFGLWAEQLIAESTGKEGKGLLPVAAEPLGDPKRYSKDRVFVYLKYLPNDNRRLDSHFEKIIEAGHPAGVIEIDRKSGLGDELMRWELATAAVGSHLQINPFDEPNVTESKENTKRLIDLWQTTGSIEESVPAATLGTISLFPEGALQNLREENDPAALISRILGQAKTGDYVALLPYFLATTEREEALQALRSRISEKTGLPTTLGYGPRYLHSTGQLHKGGPNRGIFFIFSAAGSETLPIPDQPFDFSVLQKAQALGDLESLSAKGFRVVRMQLAGPIEEALQELLTIV